MVKNSVRKPGRSASTPLEKTISELINNLLEDKTTALREQNGEIDESDPHSVLQSTALAKDLQYSEILFYAQSKVLRLQREKKVILEKAIDKSLREIREAEHELFLEAHGIDLNAPLEIEEPLVEPVDENKMNKSIVNTWNLQDSGNGENGVEDAEEKSKKRPKESSKHSASKRNKVDRDRSAPTLTLDDLGGMDDLKDELNKSVILPMQHPEIYKLLNIEPSRGILFNGPPGCGKTTIANALAGTLQVPFISLSAPSVVSGMSGESEKKIRDIFLELKNLAPCLIFFDEIDAITPKRDGGAQREMERRIVAQLLTSIDELSFEKTDGKPVIVLAATNRPDSLDPLLRRAGRFDKEIVINVPNEETRFQILKSMTQKMKTDGELKLMKLAKMTPGFVGADLKSLTTAAGVCAIKRIFKEIVDRDDEILQDQNLIEALNSDRQDQMDIDENFVDPINPIVDLSKLSTIQKFLQRHQSPLTEDQLNPLYIKFEDFLEALPSIQPTLMREGFAIIPDVSWSNVGALQNIRTELQMAIVQPIKRPQLYKKVGITAPSGVLMWGPPGCGKTLLAKLVANESKLNFISIKGPELLNKYVGESEKAVRQVFQRASLSIPCIVFFDELDALVPRRDASLSESSSRVVNTLLTELDGLSNRSGIFVIGATNRPDMIDPLMLRPGRLDKTLYIQLPSLEERFEILKTCVGSNGTPLAADVDLNVVAHDEKCRNFSGADLSSLVREASVIALKQKFFTQISTGNEEVLELVEGVNGEEVLQNDDIEVKMVDFLDALNTVKPSVSDKDRVKYERLNKRLGWSKTEVPMESSNIQDS